MALRRLAGIALGLALPLTIVGAASADYTDAQIALSGNPLGIDEDSTFDITLPVFGGIAVVTDGSRAAGADVVSSISDIIIFGPSDE